MGLLSACGLGLVDYLALKATGAVRTRPLAKSCILIWLDGGPSHLETFDPKPEAPAEVRGPFQSITTNVPGISICEHLPRTAGVCDRLAILRSVYVAAG